MFRAITDRVKRDKDYPARQYTLDIYSRVLEGCLYEHLPNGFHTEIAPNGEYVPLRSRRPSVKTNLCRTVVDDSVSLVFDDAHFPKVYCEDETTKETILALIKEAKLGPVMLDAATQGSKGSVAIQMRVLPQPDRSNRVFFKPHCTQFLTPFWTDHNPDELARIEERYKVKGRDLKGQGYAIDAEFLAADFWFGRDWDTDAETWFTPWLVKRSDKPNAPNDKGVDTEKTVQHKLGFVPWVWIKNLPGKLKLISANPEFSDADGACTFAAAIEAMIEIDYQLSQSGRGLKYSMDPMLMIKEPASPVDDEEFVKSPGYAMVVSEKGDAKMLEIGGEAFKVVLDYVKAVREAGLEAVHGNRVDPDKLTAAQSGKAMEIMNQALIWLASKLRSSYGEDALLALLNMVRKAHVKYPLTIDGKKIEALSDKPLVLQWPPWHAPTHEDLQSEATTVTTLRDSGVLSRETAVNIIAPSYDIEDTAAELGRIKKDIAEATLVMQEQAAQPKPAESAPL